MKDLFDLQFAPSREILKALEGRTVILKFSRGKDSICSWLALKEAGVNVIPLHLTKTPGVSFVRNSLDWFENYFDQHIYNLVHPVFWDWLAEGFMQTPGSRRSALEVGLPQVHDQDDLNAYIGGVFGLDEVIVCEGVRSKDSAMRSFSYKRHGAVRASKHGTIRIHPVHDYTIAQIREMMFEHGCLAPRFEYEQLGRTFDALTFSHLWAIKKYLPKDYEILRVWFPNIDQAMWRYQVSGEGKLKPVEKKELSTEDVNLDELMGDIDIDLDAINLDTPVEKEEEKMPTDLEGRQETTLKKVANARSRQQNYTKMLFDSNYATQIVFQTQAQRDAFAEQTQWENEEGFIDGIALSRAMEIELPEIVDLPTAKIMQPLPDNLLQPAQVRDDWEPLEY